ncbi:MAG: hypothetical protein HYY49_05530 [Ignavibacteriales bacterium]|nr:hypothetical protein [Ignavibacteriales bacterium]
MKNIFIVYMAPGNNEQMVHYEDTIKNRVAQDRILKFVDLNLGQRLREIFLNKPIAVWGSRDSSSNRSKFEKMQIGDDILIVEGGKIRLLGKIAEKTVNPDLSQELWQNIQGGTREGWNLVYFIANPIELDLPFARFRELFDYEPNYTLRGFTSVSEERVERFIENYGDLYSALERLKKEKKVEKRPPAVKEPLGEYPQREESIAEKPEPVDEATLSEHVTMQWKLVQLGLKSGSKVWVPRNDQGKIQSSFGFSEFEQQFTAGIDMQAKYVENIDVVWKEEFRIDAAFEIENTTSIYSGLLRFSDLKIVAPNSIYPLFIVAPQAKKNRVLEQVKRPTFRRIEFNKKVRFLSYEGINEVDTFFAKSTAGLNIDILLAKSEGLD